MCLFPKNISPFQSLLLNILSCLHPSLGKSHDISTCLSPPLCVDLSCDRCLPSYFFPFTLHLVTFISPSHKKWYSALHTFLWNNPCMLWIFLGHMAMASPSINHSCGIQFTNVMSLEFTPRDRFPLVLFVCWKGTHRNHKYGGTFGYHLKPWFNWPLDHFNPHVNMWCHSRSDFQFSECTIGRIQVQMQS